MAWVPATVAKLQMLKHCFHAGTVLMFFPLLPQPTRGGPPTPVPAQAWAYLSGCMALAPEIWCEGARGVVHWAVPEHRDSSGFHIRSVCTFLGAS